MILLTLDLLWWTGKRVVGTVGSLLSYLLFEAEEDPNDRLNRIELELHTLRQQIGDLNSPQGFFENEAVHIEDLDRPRVESQSHSPS